MSTKRPGADAVAHLREALPVPALAYQPTDAQRDLKARFWLAFKQNPITDTGSISPALVEQLTGVSVQSWLSDKRFWVWFSVKDQIRQNLEVAAEKASELAIMYMDPSFPLNDNARVQLIKYILEFAGRSPPSRKEIKWADKEVQDMSPEELDQLIARYAAKLPPREP